MRAVVQQGYGGTEHLDGPARSARAGARSRGGGGRGPSRRHRPRYLAPDDRRAVADAAVSPGLPRTPAAPAVPGRDLAGVVAGVGPGVTGFAVGDEVYGPPPPSFRPLAGRPHARSSRSSAWPPAAACAEHPEESAAVPISGWTALQAVRAPGGVTAGQRVMVIGASGGVGDLRRPARCGGRRRGHRGVQHLEGRPPARPGPRRNGSSTTRSRTRADLAGERFDVVLDIGGNRPLRQLRELLTLHGTLVIVGGEGGGRWLGGLGRNLWLKLLAPFAQQRLVAMLASENRADLETLARARRAGRVPPRRRADVPARGVGEGDRAPAGGPRSRQGGGPAVTPAFPRCDPAPRVTLSPEEPAAPGGGSSSSVLGGGPSRQ